MKIFLKILILLLPFIINSCSLFRSLGLYNVPPKYSETYEEITGKKFINHSNNNNNLKLILKPLKKEFSPYEKIELILKVYNVSNIDTMYIYEPRIFYPGKLIIKDSLNKKIKVLEGEATVDYMAMVDDYGRRIKPTIAPNNTKISPKDSLVKILSFRTGKRICNDIECRYSFKRESIPSIYRAYYTQNHEEYDEIKGPIFLKISSNTIEYKISKYTNDELKIRSKVNEIITSAESGSDSLTLYNLYSKFKKEFPNNLYSPQIKEYLNLHNSLIRNRKK